jgi:hypothetical protein
MHIHMWQEFATEVTKIINEAIANSAPLKT